MDESLEEFVLEERENLEEFRGIFNQRYKKQRGQGGCSLPCIVKFLW